MLAEATDTIVVSTRIMKNPMTRAQRAGHGLRVWASDSAAEVTSERYTRDNERVSEAQSIPGWRHVYSGKVRDLYASEDPGDDRIGDHGLHRGATRSRSLGHAVHNRFARPGHPVGIGRITMVDVPCAGRVARP